MKTKPFIDNEALPRGFGKRGGLFCPVCRMEAYKQGINENERKLAWFHEGRAWPCVKKIGTGDGARTGTVQGAGPVGDDPQPAIEGD